MSTQAPAVPSSPVKPRKAEVFHGGVYPSLAGLAAMGSDVPEQEPPLRDQIDAALEQYRKVRDWIYELNRFAGGMPPDAVSARARLLYPLCRFVEASLA